MDQFDHNLAQKSNKTDIYKIINQVEKCVKIDDEVKVQEKVNM